MDKKRVYILIEGRVQGVFFRVTARDMATSLEVKGWVKNRWDGKVELIAEGKKNAVNKIIKWCYEGPPGAIVINVEIEIQSFKGEFNNFSIQY